MIEKNLIYLFIYKFNNFLVFISVVTQNGQTAGIKTALATGNTLIARSAFKMSAYSGGVEGAVYAQQVQITGG